MMLCIKASTIDRQHLIHCRFHQIIIINVFNSMFIIIFLCHSPWLYTSLGQVVLTVFHFRLAFFCSYIHLVSSIDPHVGEKFVRSRNSSPFAWIGLSAREVFNKNMCDDYLLICISSIRLLRLSIHRCLLSDAASTSLSPSLPLYVCLPVSLL